MQVRSAWNRMRFGASRHPGRMAALILIVLPALALLATMLLVALGQGFARADGDAEATAMLGVLLTLALLGSFIGAMTASLQSLYLARDLTFLMTLPIPLRMVFAGKVLEATIGSLPGGLLAMVAIAAFGIRRDASWLLIPVAFLIVYLLMLLATAIAAAIVALVVGVVPVKRIRSVLLAVILLVVLLALTAWTALAPSRASLENGEALGRLEGALRWLPTGHAGAAALAAARMRPLDLAVESGVLLLATVAALIMAFQVFARTFSRSVGLAESIPSTRSGRAFGRWTAAAVRPLPSAVGAIVLKEWLTTARDLRRLSGAIWPLGMVLFYAATASRRVSAEGDGAYRFWLEHGAFALVPWGISLGSTIYAIGMEQRGIQLLRLIPVSTGRLLLAKFLAAFIPILLVSEVIAFVAVGLHRPSLNDAASLLALVAWTSFGFVAIDLAASAIAPNFDAPHVQRSVELVGRAAGLVAGSLFGLATAVGTARLVMFSAGAPESWRGALEWELGGMTPLGWPLIVAAFALAAGVVGFALVTAKRSLDRLIEHGP
ncbi:MAG TPA: hypothetical protein VIL01_10810 [Thermomicrobiales bacterium]